MMTDIPTLRTERLNLRTPTYADWPAFRDLLQSERSAFMGGPYTVEGALGGVLPWHGTLADVRLW